MITPIYNNPSCFKAACHVHPEAQKVLGVIDMGMSLKGFDSHRRSLVLNIVSSRLWDFCRGAGHHRGVRYFSRVQAGDPAARCCHEDHARRFRQ